MSGQPKAQKISASDRTKGKKGSSLEKIALKMKGAFTSAAIPAGFNLAKATPAELDHYGFPQENTAPKDPRTSAIRALIERQWTPKNRIMPELHTMRGVTHVFRPKGPRVRQANAPSQTSNNWSGGIVLEKNTAPLPKPGSPLDGYATPFNEQQHVNYIGADNHVYELYYTSTAWKFNDLTALTGASNADGASALAGYSTTFNNQQHVNFVGDNHHIYELLYDNGWSVNDLTLLSGNQSVAQPNSAVASYQTTFNEQQHVIFLDSNNHIHELFYDSQWHDNDLTNTTGGPVATQASRLAAYQTAFNQQQHIIYQSFDGHIQELVYDGSWKHNDLTSAAGAGKFPAILLTPLDGYATEYNKQQHVNYIGVDGSVHELFYINSWSHTDLIKAAGPGAPLPAPGSRLDGYPTEFNEQQHVNYVAADGHVHELYYQNSWQHNDISALSGSPINTVAGSSLDGYGTGFNEQQHVNYIGVDGHVHELFYDNSWQSNDLTASALVPWTSAFGFWKVPTVSRADEPESDGGGWKSSTWVGIDGWLQNDVLQTGTRQQVDGDGDAEYYAWYEWFTPEQSGSPDYIWETKIENFPVSPGQEMFASVQYINGNTRGRLFLANVNTGDYFTIDLDPPPGAPFNGACIEWIMEDPDKGEPTASLADFTPVEFTTAFGADAAGNSGDPSKGITTVIQRGSTTLTAVTATVGDCIIRYLPWHDTDLNGVAPGAVNAAINSPLDGYATNFNEQQHINYIGVDSHVHELFYEKGWQANDLTAAAGAPNPAVNSPLDGYSTEFNEQQHVNFIGADLHVHELYFDGSWKHNDLTALGGAPNPAVNSPLDGYPTQFNEQQHVNFIGADLHVHELYYDGAWKHNDLTALAAGAPNAAVNSPLDGYATGFNEQQHVNYIGVDGHVHELFYDGSWKHNDLTAAAGAPNPAINSPLDGYSTEFNEQQHINFIGADLHIHELYYDGSWKHNDLTVLAAGAPNAAVNSKLDGYSTTYNEQQHVNYIGVDNQVHELFYDGSWKHNDLSNASGLFTTPLNGTPLAGYQTSFNDQQHVIFIATNLHTHELYF